MISPSHPPSSDFRRPSIFTILLLSASVALYFWTNIWNAWHGINSNDFKHIYFGMKSILDGISPYTFDALHHQAALQGYNQISLNPYVYLPFTGQSMLFLAPFRLNHAVAVWFTLNHIFVGLSLWFISSLWPTRRLFALALLVFAMAISFPLYRTLTAGQLNCALLFFICGGWRLMRANRPAVAGFVMAFATLYKLMPGIYVLLFLLQRRWRAFIAVAISGIVLFALSTVAAGLQMTLDFIAILSQMGYGKSTWPDVFSFWNDPSNQSLNSFFSHILTMNGHTKPWVQWGQQSANLFTTITTIALLLTYILTIWIASHNVQSTRRFTRSDDVVWGATLLLGLLIPSLLWDHYLVMTILPLALIIRSAMELHKRWALGLAILCWLLICTPWQFNNPGWTHGLGIFLMSMKLWPTLVLFGLSLCFVFLSGSPDGNDQPPSNASQSNLNHQEKPSAS